MLLIARSKPFLAFLFSLTISAAIAQNSLLFNQVAGVQQTLQRNPAKPFDAKVAVAIGSAFVGYQNNLFDYGDFNQNLPALPQLEAIVQSHTQTEVINLNARADLLGVSVLTKAGRFSVGLSQRADLKTSIPEEFSNYLFLGNDYLKGRTVEVSDFKVEASSFIEVALRYQTPSRGNGLRFGGSLKILGGQGHGVITDALARTTNTTASDTFFVEAQGRLRTSGFSNFGSDTLLSVATLLRQPSNMGLGLDLGLHYQLDEVWSFGLSVIDIGFIRWKRRIYDASFGASFRSSGVPSVVSSSADIETFVNATDALIVNEPFTGTKAPNDFGDAYNRALFPSALGSVDAQISDEFAVGASYVYDADNRGGQHRFGVNGSVSAGKYVQALAGYSFAGPKHVGLGVGLVLALGPLQVYATADNVLELIDQDQLNGVAVNAGANLIFPMVWFENTGRNKSSGRKGKAVKCYKF